MRKLLLLAIFIMSYSLSVFAQTSEANGEWIDPDTWIGTPPTYAMSGQGNNAINIIVNASNMVHTNQGLTLGGNTGNINIYGKLTINDGLTITGQKWKINVHDDGELIINGGLHFSQPSQGSPATPDLTINGIASINGGISGTGDLFGDGELYMHDSEIGENITVNLFNGNIVYGNTDITLPAPYELEGTDINGTSVFLEWEFDTNYPAEFEFIGFQVFKNNDRTATPPTPTYSASVITGYTEYETNFTVKGLEEFSFTDNDVESGDQPKYYVRAVYIRTSDNVIIFSGISNTKDFWFQPLPVELLSLSATTRGNQVEVAWTTATEINNMGFEIQRMSGNNNWEAIGFVDGNYYHNGIINYNFMDVFPLEGINYYRLKQMDYDGAFEFYGPVAADVNATGESFSLKVVKKADELFVLLPGQAAGLLEVFDMQGRMVFSSFANGNIKLPLAKGSYILRYFNGQDLATAKVVL